MIKKALIFAAGEGTRLRPITAAVPKEMLPIIDTPVIQYVLEEVCIPGVEEVVILTNRKKAVLSEYLTTRAPDAVKKILEGVTLRFVYQEDVTSEYGTGAALRAVEDHVKDGPFILAFADSFCLPAEKRFEKMAEAFEELHAPIFSLIRIHEGQLRTYGVPRKERVRDGVYRIIEMLEKPERAPDDELMAYPGGVILTPDIFSYVRDLQKEGAEVPLTPAFTAYYRDHAAYGQLFTGHFFEAGNRIDCAKSILDMAFLREDTGEALRAYLKEK